MEDRADYYLPDPQGDRKCKPGNKHEPQRCDYHPKHYWCVTCEGFYGVPHDFIHEGPNKHPMAAPRNCACRPCMDLVASRAS